jgi:hypothetical protein
VHSQGADFLARKRKWPGLIKSPLELNDQGDVQRLARQSCRCRKPIPADRPRQEAALRLEPPTQFGPPRRLVIGPKHEVLKINRVGGVHIGIK